MLFSSGIRFFRGPAGFRVALRPFGKVRNLRLHASVSLPQPDGTASQRGKCDAAAQDDIEAQTRQPAATGTTSGAQQAAQAATVPVMASFRENMESSSLMACFGVALKATLRAR